MPTVDQLYDEAIELQQAGKLDEAVGRLEGLVVDHPDYALAHAALSVFYGKMGRQDEAVAARPAGLRTRARRPVQLHGDEPDLSAGGPNPRGRAGDGDGDGEAMGRAARRQRIRRHSLFHRAASGARVERLL